MEAGHRDSPAGSIPERAVKDMSAMQALWRRYHNTAASILLGCLLGCSISMLSAQPTILYPVQTICDTACTPPWWCDIVLAEADGVLRWPAWSGWKQAKRDSVRQGLPIHHMPRGIQKPIASDVDIRPLVWTSNRRLNKPWQYRSDSSVPWSRFEWIHTVLVGAQFRANTGDKLWLLMIGTVTGDSLGQGYGDPSGNSGWSFPMLQTLIPDTSMMRYGQSPASMPIQYQKSRIYRAKPKGKDVLVFIADVYGRSQEELARNFRLAGDDPPEQVRLEFGAVCPDAWRWMTGEEPTARVVLEEH